VSFHMYLKVVLYSHISLSKVIKYYHLFGWGIPLVLAGATSAIRGHGFSPPIPYCFIHSATPENYSDLPKGLYLPLDYSVFDI
jgi:hypothetical protein